MATDRLAHDRITAQLLCWVRAGQHHGAIPVPPEWWFVAQAAQDQEREEYRQWLRNNDPVRSRQVVA